MKAKKMTFLFYTLFCVVLVLCGVLLLQRNLKETLYASLFLLSSTTFFYAYLYQKPLPMDRDVPLEAQTKRSVYIFMPILLFFSGVYIVLNGLN